MPNKVFLLLFFSIKTTGSILEYLYVLAPEHALNFNMPRSMLKSLSAESSQKSPVKCEINMLWFLTEFFLMIVFLAANI